MKKTVVAMSGLLVAGSCMGQTLSFDTDTPGTLPAAWEQGVTGRGTPRWTVRQDPSAPSAPNVLQQSGTGTFPWCVLRGSSVENGFIEVKFKPLEGREDQAGGVVWRWKDGDNYYVARANALENNVSLYHTTAGSRRTIEYKDAPVATNVWHTLRVDFKDTAIRVSLDGKAYIDLKDNHIQGSGKAGVWTKADSVTLFDAFTYGRSSP